MGKMIVQEGMYIGSLLYSSESHQYACEGVVCNHQKHETTQVIRYAMHPSCPRTSTPASNADRNAQKSIVEPAHTVSFMLGLRIVKAITNQYCAAYCTDFVLPAC